MNDEELYKLLSNQTCVVIDNWCSTHDYKGSNLPLCDFALAMVKSARKGMGLSIHDWKKLND